MKTFHRQDGAEKLLRKIKKSGASIGAGISLDSVFAILIDCTAFADKKDMLRKCKMLIDVSSSELKRLFEGAEKLRNKSGHTGNDIGDLPLPIKELRQTVADVRQGIATIREACEREWKGASHARPKGKA